MNIFYPNLKNLTIVVLIFLGHLINAQNINNLTITNADGEEISIPVTLGQFGDLSGNAVSGGLMLAEDILACEAVTNNLTGSIAIIDRGACEFGAKCLNAEAAGAIAVIICNNNPDNTFAMGPGTLGDQVNVLAVMATGNNCDILKMELESGSVAGTLAYIPLPCGIEYDSTVVWGFNGEGAFDGGLGDWVTKGVSDEEDIWIWDGDATPNGCFCQSSVFLTSKTWCNGVALFDSDAYNNIFNPECDFYSPDVLDLQHSGNLTSPTIDLADVPYPVVEFTSYLLGLNSGLNNLPDGAGIAYSIDNGMTWIDTIPIITEYECTASIFSAGDTPEEVSVSIPELANQAGSRIRFIFANDLYFWMIDDVVIKNLPQADVEVMTNWYAVAPNYLVPASQVEPFPMMVDVENNGNVDITGVNLEARVTNSGGDVIYSENIDYETLLAQEDDWNRIFPVLVDPPIDVVDDYTGSYILSSDNDGDDTNNRIDFGFRTTESTFSKVMSEEEAGFTYLGNRSTPNEFYETYGNYYYVPRGEGWYAKTIEFGVNIALLEESPGFISINLYQWVDSNNNGLCEPDERFELSKDDILVSAEDFTQADLRRVTVNLTPTNGNAIPLFDDSHYLACVHMRPLGTGELGNQYRILAANRGVNPNFSYEPMNFAFAQSQEINRFGTMFAVGGDDSEADINARTFGINNFWAAYIPLTLTQTVSTQELNSEIIVSVGPNPASDYLEVEFRSEISSNKIGLELYTTDGRFIQKNAEYLNGQRTYMDVSDITPGMYILNIRTEDGFISKKVVIN